MNELLLLGEAAISAALVLLAWRLGKKRFFYGVILIFLLLIATVGGKIVVFFGHETNTGNIFYASIFLAMYFFVERQGERDAIHSIWASVIGVAFFFSFVQMTVALNGSSVTAPVNEALVAAFAPFSRITVASLIAYVLSQNLNVYLYAYLKRRVKNHLWFRANACNIAAQAMDSIIFFTVAFWGIVAPANVVDIMLTGFTIKIIFVAITSPLLYLNRIEIEEGIDYAKISVR